MLRYGCACAGVIVSASLDEMLVSRCGLGIGAGPLDPPLRPAPIFEIMSPGFSKLPADCSELFEPEQPARNNAAHAAPRKRFDISLDPPHDRPGGSIKHVPLANRKENSAEHYAGNLRRGEGAR